MQFKPDLSSFGESTVLGGYSQPGDAPAPLPVRVNVFDACNVGVVLRAVLFVEAVVGVGAGQMSRIDSTEISIKKAGNKVKGAVMASDAFFPFRDSVDTAAKAGIAAIIQPGGSNKDDESIAAADEHGIAMVFTGQRHFRH